MRNKKKISAIVLAGTMILSMGANVFAASTVGKASITKDFVMAEGIATPVETFNFQAEAETEGAPEVTIQSISFDGTEKNDPVNGIMKVSKDSEIVFGAFPHAGEYEYTVTETNENKEGVEYSEDTYTLRVYVKNGDNGPEVKEMTAEKGADASKVEKIVFTNTYRKNAALTIKNNTTGELADKTKEFNFTIKITPSATEKNPTSYTGRIETGTETETVTVNADTPKIFTLHDGETLKFDSLPAGTRYVVTEAGEEGYIPSVDVKENNVDTVVDKTAKEGEGISSADGESTNLVGEHTNEVTFTNAYNPAPITGIIMNNLPFVLVISVAVLALGALAILKKQRFGRR